MTIESKVVVLDIMHIGELARDIRQKMFERLGNAQNLLSSYLLGAARSRIHQLLCCQGRRKLRYTLRPEPLRVYQVKKESPRLLFRALSDMNYDGYIGNSSREQHGGLHEARQYVSHIST